MFTLVAIFHMAPIVDRVYQVVVRKKANPTFSATHERNFLPLRNNTFPYPINYLFISANCDLALPLPCGL
jgi:hypothetical protein